MASPSLTMSLLRLCVRARPAAASLLPLRPAMALAPSSIALPARAHAVAPLPARPLSSKPPKRPSKIVGQELTKALGTLQGWDKLLERDCLVKKFEFEDFNECWGVMSRVAVLAEKLNHHPKWNNVYNQLRIELETHDLNGLSDMDIYMAQQIDAYVAAVRKPSLTNMKK